jgi:proteasome lid subunit RPN8/RPN11
VSRLFIDSALRQRIRRHAESSYPEECCGFLIGRTAADASSVERIVPAGNERQESRHNRYLISPEAVLAAHKAARAQGLDVIGYYHSHPDHPARPSAFDREHAWPGLSYLIVSIEQGSQVDARSWRLRDDREDFDEETLDAAAGSPANGPSGAARQKETAP